MLVPIIIVLWFTRVPSYAGFFVWDFQMKRKIFSASGRFSCLFEYCLVVVGVRTRSWNRFWIRYTWFDFGLRPGAYRSDIAGGWKRNEKLKIFLLRSRERAKSFLRVYCYRWRTCSAKPKLQSQIYGFVNWFPLFWAAFQIHQFFIQFCIYFNVFQIGSAKNMVEY